MNLRGKWVLITGAAKRVGRSTSLELARRGANILLHYNRSQADAEKTASEIKALGVRCELLQADLSRSAAIGKMLEVLARTAPVDVLVNNASEFYKAPLDKATEEDFDRLVTINLKAPFLLSKEIGKRMIAANGGKIINIADWSAFRPYRDYAPYCAAKGGLVTLTKSLAREFGPKVMANAVAPGPVMLPEDFGQAEREAIAKLTVLGRIGTPEDVARAVAFLLENDFMNGTVLIVDGGRSLV